MFRAAPMARVTLWFLASEAQDAALLLARHGEFAPVSPAEGGGALKRHEQARNDQPPHPVTLYREIFLEAESRLRKLQEFVREPAPSLTDDAIAPALIGLQGTNERLKSVWQAFSATVETLTEISEEQRNLRALQESFARLHGLNLDLSRLFHPDSLLNVRIGSVPVGNLPRLQEAMALGGYVLAEFERSGEQVFAVIVGPRGSDVAGLLSQSGWRDMNIPDALRTRPEEARRYLDERGAALSWQWQQAQAALAAHHQRHGERIREAATQLALARPLAEAAHTGVGHHGQLVMFTGWMPKSGLNALQTALAARFHGRFLSEVRAPQADELAKVPSLLRYPGWLQPFAPLVRGYGLPRYGEFDPTLPFAVGYLLLFGAMFGDVGQGAVILLVALLLGRRLGRVRWVGVAAGAASMGFGVAYGSVFGREDLIAPRWLSPMHEPTHLLLVAIGLGAVFLVLTFVANIHNRLAQGQVAAALGAANGVAGLVFYLGALAWSASLAGWGDWGFPGSVLAATGLGFVALHVGMESRSPWGERLLVTAIETLETGVNLFANTLSFMRVAAFSLNHVALALAVFALSQGLGPSTQLFTEVLGNMVVIVLEGGIVAIQAMRLMYYEGFSRFFSGDGVDFKPLALLRH